MLGAILGDIIGSPYEFDQGSKSKVFELFDRCCEFTDDTVMTIAMCQGLMNAGKYADESTVKKEITRCMRMWGRKYPYAGYGSRFVRWLFDEQKGPYGSYGNGSAMRVSSVGWLYDSLERTREVARWSSEVTHNHVEGIKGAECIASLIYLARTGSTKEEMKDFAMCEFGYDLSRPCDQIRPGYTHDESCQRTVPEAITAFLEGESFEDVIRTAVSLGGDCDTLTCIAGSLASAYYGIPGWMKQKAYPYLKDEMIEVVEQFERKKREVMKKNLIELVFILDRSGSMKGLEADTIGGFNSLIEKQKKEAGEVLVSTVLFDHTQEILHDRVNLSDIQPLTEKDYTVRGSTALLDAVGGAIHHIGNIHKYAREEDRPLKTLFVITTDGVENASRHYSYGQIRQMVERQKERYGWEFLFLGANIDAVAEAQRFGIGDKCAVQFENDSVGTAVNYAALNEAVRTVRSCPAAQEALDGSWKKEIEKDYKQRARR